MVLRRFVYVNNDGNIQYFSSPCPRAFRTSPFHATRQCHHSDLVFFQDSLLLKRELLKTATLNVPGSSRIWEEWGTLFFLSGLSVISFYSIFRPTLGEGLFRQLLSWLDSSSEFIIVSLPWTITRASNKSFRSEEIIMTFFRDVERE